MKKIIFILLAGSMCVFNSCTKTGPKGDTGNANVIGEDAFTIGNSSIPWVYAANVYSATLTDDNITSDIAANGLVEIYKQYPDNSWTNLPDINGDVTTVYNFYPHGFVISVLTTDNTTTPTPDQVNFRVVVVPSSVRKAHPNTNWKNYNEAMAAMNSTTSAAATTVAQ